MYDYMKCTARSSGQIRTSHNKRLFVRSFVRCMRVYVKIETSLIDINLCAPLDSPSKPGEAELRFCSTVIRVDERKVEQCDQIRNVMTGHTLFSCTIDFNCRVSSKKDRDRERKKERTAMYTFNLCPLHSTINHKTNAGTSMPSKLNIEECSIKRLKEQIAQILALNEDSFGRRETLLHSIEE